MIDYSKYQLNEENRKFIKELSYIEEDQTFTILNYNNEFEFCIEMENSKVHIYSEGKELGVFDTIEDMILTFQIDGKPFIELIDKINYV